MVYSRRTFGVLKSSLARGLWCALVFGTGPYFGGRALAATTPAEEQPAAGEHARLVDPRPNSVKDWGVQFGVAIISQSNIGEIFAGERAEGPAGGQLYLLTLTRTVHRFEIPFFGRSLTPEVEPYVTFTLVDENESAPFPDYNGGVGFRWVDFPWNKWVKTTLFVGIGLSYSAHVYRVDRQRHPGEERSHLKFDWPIQLTLALPRWPQHQLVLFNDHQSGGHVFDKGGVNSLGLGYRFEF